MKTKFFLAAAIVVFFLAMISCGDNKTVNSGAATDSTSIAIEAVESTATCCKGDSVVCDSTKACCEDKAVYDQKTECPQNANCEKKACDKKQSVGIRAMIEWE